MPADMPTGEESIRFMDRLLVEHRPQREIFVDRLTLGHQGPFDMNELRNLIIEWTQQNHYIYDELIHKEIVHEHGKDIEIKFEFQKKASDVKYLVLHLEIEMEHLEEVEGRRGKYDATLWDGRLTFIFNGFTETVLRDRWETKPYYYFIRWFLQKYIYRVDRERYRGILIKETRELYNKLHGYLLLQKKLFVPREGHGEEHGEREQEEKPDVHDAKARKVENMEVP